MNSTSTPGPWQIQPLDHDFLIVHSDRELRSHIARLQWATLCEEHGNLESNACLIAAAPELLAALESILSSTCGDIGDDGYDGCIRIEAKSLDRAREVISKATGGAL